MFPGAAEQAATSQRLWTAGMYSPTVLGAGSQESRGMGPFAKAPGKTLCLPPAPRWFLSTASALGSWACLSHPSSSVLPWPPSLRGPVPTPPSSHEDASPWTRGHPNICLHLHLITPPRPYSK